MKRLICFLLSILGFAAVGCDGDGWDDQMVMYGTPITSYKFNARVVDPEGNPIKGIKVTISEDDDFNIDWMEVLDTETNEEGMLVQHTTQNVSPAHHLYVRLLDVDGYANGGEFKNEQYDISKQLSEAKKIELGDGWYNGRYEVNVGDIQLEHWNPSTDGDSSTN